MNFLSERLQEYIRDHSEKEPSLLQDLAKETHLKVVRPRMLTGHYQGRVLSMFSKLISPKHILEIGTYTGYSAICLAEGLQQKGQLHTIESNEELYDIQRRFFDRTGQGEQFFQHVGDAKEIIPRLDILFDLVFIDANKKEYSEYLELVLEKTRSGSIILSDNVLWSGKVVEASANKDKSTKKLLDYNKKLREDDRVETILLPIRDGLTVSRVR